MKGSFEELELNCLHGSQSDAVERNEMKQEKQLLDGFWK